ncbi:peptidylprolyl isomerase [uncultured Sphingomonas sp.]|uniref:peptidylprolyl isomerase n=1 Tax=uncultured Sphingomonas sp. TaxID=158754 RepID=UPI0035CB5E00
MTRGLLLSLALALFAPLAIAQTAPTPVVTPSPLLPRVAIETSVGRIVVEIETGRAPVTAANFLKYVDQKRLDGITFYRTVKVADHFGFVQFGVNGDARRVLPPIRHEATTATGIRHLDGVLSMPRREPGTAQGEFTIMVGDQPSMDADPTRPGDTLGYAAFGRVVEGMDVVLKIFDAAVSPTATIRGGFRGEVPAAPVKLLTARRVK